MPRASSLKLFTGLVGAALFIVTFGPSWSSSPPEYAPITNRHPSASSHAAAVLRKRDAFQTTFGWLPSGWKVQQEPQDEVEGLFTGAAGAVADAEEEAAAAANESAPAFVPLHTGRVPSTELVKGVAGFNFFHSLYLNNGTWYFVTDDAEDAGFPSQGPSYIMTETGGTTHRVPGPDRWQVITLDQVQEKLGNVALFFNDQASLAQKSFLGHYYHCEMFLGLWRLTVSAGHWEIPTRLIYMGQADEWRDRARITPWFQRTILAGCEVEETPDWLDLKESGVTYVYDKIGIADRWAAHNHGNEVRYWNKANADIPSLIAPSNWMEPLRDRVVQFAESGGCLPKRAAALVPVVTYIDRQTTGRRLKEEDHKCMVEELQVLHNQGDIELHVVQMEHISRGEQFCLAARTDIMIGVHGNGLSHQLWMRPGGGVLELAHPGGIARDYSILAELMHHEYYVVHNDTYLPPSKWRKDDGWSIGVGEGSNFHGSKIPVYGPWVASLVKDMATRRRYGPTPMQW